MGFRAGCEAFVFFGALAFGFRTSLFDLFCPLAISLDLPPHASRLLRGVGGRAVIEVSFQALEQSSPCRPGLGAALEDGTHMFT